MPFVPPQRSSNEREYWREVRAEAFDLYSERGCALRGAPPCAEIAEMNFEPPSGRDGTCWRRSDWYVSTKA